MGKVGSWSIYDSLRLYGIKAVFHTHRMNPIRLKEITKKRVERYLKNKGPPPPDFTLAKMLYRLFVKNRKKAKFITLVREPIGRNISAFFQNFYIYTGVEYDKAKFSIDEIIKLFLNNYDHTNPFFWVDEEIKETLNIDVYKYAFPQEKGYQLIKKKNFELLIIKIEIDDSIIEEVVKNFLNLDDDFKLIRSNVGNKKNYSEMYQKFKQIVNLPESYIEKMLNSKYTKHFYSDREIESLKSKWTAS